MQKHPENINLFKMCLEMSLSLSYNKVKENGGVKESFFSLALGMSVSKGQSVCRSVSLVKTETY